jgi:hypothetical protein
MSKPSNPSHPSGDPAGGSAGEPPLLFVDQIDAGSARLLLGEEAFSVPARLLPGGVKEGTWLRWSFSSAPPPPDVGAAIRRKLQQGDDGGDIKL